MIIKICGTSGSGKTWVMRQVMEQLGPWLPQYVAGRKKPLWSLSPSHNIAVMGHYESACGGCDNIGSAPEVYKAIRQVLESSQSRHASVPRILSEGLLWSEDVKWTRELLNLAEVRSVFLTTPLDRCLHQIQERRALVGNEKPLNPENTSNRVSVIERARLKSEGVGILSRRASAKQAVGIILDWLGYAPAGSK